MILTVIVVTGLVFTGVGAAIGYVLGFIAGREPLQNQIWGEAMSTSAASLYSGA